MYFPLASRASCPRGHIAYTCSVTYASSWYCQVLGYIVLSGTMLEELSGTVLEYAILSGTVVEYAVLSRTVVEYCSIVRYCA